MLNVCLHTLSIVLGAVLLWSNSMGVAPQMGSEKECTSFQSSHTIHSELLLIQLLGEWMDINAELMHTEGPETAASVDDSKDNLPEFATHTLYKFKAIHANRVRNQMIALDLYFPNHSFDLLIPPPDRA